MVAPDALIEEVEPQSERRPARGATKPGLAPHGPDRALRPSAMAADANATSEVHLSLLWRELGRGVSQVVDVNKGLHCFSAKNPRERRKVEALPERENKSYLVTVGKDVDLNKAMDDAAWAMIELLQNQKNLTRLDAYGLASMVMDCRLAAPVGSQKAVYCLLPTSTWVAAR